MRRRSLLFAVAAALILGCGLSATTSSDNSSFGGSDNASPPTGGGGTVAFGAPDGAADAGRASDISGSALCAHTSSDCFPDGPQNGFAQCVVSADGGPASGGGSGSGGDADGGEDGGAAAVMTEACRVRLDTSGAPKPVCMASGAGQDGAECNVSTDCAAGYECVGSPGQCRHYCCDVSACTTSQQFCDIQTVADVGSLRVPVCMPVRPCKLLATDGCANSEQCEVVDDQGTTSCVALGPLKEGDSCETNHCGENLTCLGVPGSRKCYKLCETQKNDCAAGESCKSSAPLFRDPAIGVCVKL